MPTVVKVVLLSVIQGLTEILPVSSSGHLVLARHLLGLKSQGAVLEVALHAGTIISILLFYRGRIAGICADAIRPESGGRRYVASILAGCVPAMIAGGFFCDWFEQWFDAPHAVAAMLMVTGIIVVSLRFCRRRDNSVTLGRAILIGAAQAVAIMPGISRSGATIATARHLGVGAGQAAEFSFLMSVPLTLGAIVLTLLRSSGTDMGEVGPVDLAFGVATSAAVGYGAIRLLVRLLSADRLWWFGIYCLLAGLTALVVM